MKAPKKKIVHVEGRADVTVWAKLDLDVSDCETQKEIESAAEGQLEDQVYDLIRDCDFPDPEFEVVSIKPVKATKAKP